MEENITLKVEGMFCSNCELKIENKLLKLDGILEVKASYNKEEVKITYDKNKIVQEEIEKAITQLDYKVVKDKKTKVNIQSICIIIIIIAVYVIGNHFGLWNVFNIFPSVETTMSYGMLFVVGLLTSVHCIAMCGGINLSQSVNSVKKEGKILKSNVDYNIGRIISYTVIGGIVGAIGSVITLNGIFRGFIAILAGVLMIIMGINMLGIFPSLRKWNIRMPKKLARVLNQSKKGKSSFYIGLVNGLMPCGPLQTMQIYALSTGNFWSGALSMFLFGLGTLPLMFGFGVVASKLNKKFAGKLLAVSAVMILILGIGMLKNGLSLSGIEIHFGGRQNYENMAELKEDYQFIKTTIDYGSYEPITVKKGIKVKWIIEVPKEKLNGCNNEIIIPQYNIDIKLHEGENSIEFTPEEKGSIVYTCWMGMIRSTITVID